MRNRQPRYKGGLRIELERPGLSYAVNVGNSTESWAIKLRMCPHSLSALQMLPPAARSQAAADAVPSRHLHSSLNKVKHPINTVLWTPEGRRLLTGSSSGEFTLWNGMAFNFETIMQVCGVRASFTRSCLQIAD